MSLFEDVYGLNKDSGPQTNGSKGQYLYRYYSKEKICKGFNLPCFF
jgi:hypothetical protein